MGCPLLNWSLPGTRGLAAPDLSPDLTSPFPAPGPVCSPERGCPQHCGLSSSRRHPRHPRSHVVSVAPRVPSVPVQSLSGTRLWGGRSNLRPSRPIAPAPPQPSSAYSSQQGGVPLNPSSHEPQSALSATRRASGPVVLGRRGSRPSAGDGRGHALRGLPSPSPRG